MLFVFSAHSFSSFLLASTLAGIGLGFLLGAPLNVLVGEQAKNTEYGTALGSLSLARQVGLALFPTVFAGFISTGVMKIEPVVDATFEEPVIAFPTTDKGEGYGEIIAEIDALDNPVLQEELYSLVSAVMKTGFQ